MGSKASKGGKGIFDPKSAAGAKAPEAEGAASAAGDDPFPQDSGTLETCTVTRELKTVVGAGSNPTTVTVCAHMFLHPRPGCAHAVAGHV